MSQWNPKREILIESLHRDKDISSQLKKGLPIKWDHGTLSIQLGLELTLSIWFRIRSKIGSGTHPTVLFSQNYWKGL